MTMPIRVGAAAMEGVAQTVAQTMGAKVLDQVDPRSLSAPERVAKQFAAAGARGMLFASPLGQAAMGATVLTQGPVSAFNAGKSYLLDQSDGRAFARTAGQAAFRDQDFKSTAGWKASYATAHSTSRYKIEVKNGREQGLCETKMVLTGANAKDVARGLADLSNWQAYGKNSFHDPKRGEDSQSYTLKPIGFGLTVKEEMLDAVKHPDGNGWRIPVGLTGGANGLAYVDVQDVGGKTVVHARFAGVSPDAQGKATFGTKGFVENHLAVEAGVASKLFGGFGGIALSDGGGLFGVLDKAGQGKGWAFSNPASG